MVLSPETDRASRLHLRFLWLAVMVGCCLAFPAVFAGGDDDDDDGGGGPNCPTTKSKHNYTITFLGSTNNPDGTSTWDYTLEWDGDPPDPDHFIIELCSEAIVVSSTRAHDDIGYDGSTGLFGILWDIEGFPADSPEPFSFTLDRQYETKKIKWAVRSGGLTSKAKICGPSDKCDVENPLPVTDLVCTLTDACDCTVEVTWTDPETLEHETLVAVDGVIVAILPGGSSMHTLTLPDSGVHEICVRNTFDADQFSQPLPCGECSGKVTELTLEYKGLNAAQVDVEADNGDTVFSGVVQPGEQFSFAGTDTNGTLGKTIWIYVDGALHADLNTSCSDDIGPGQVVKDFTVIAGSSLNGGPLCPFGTGGDDDDDDDGDDDDDDDGSINCDPCKGTVTDLLLKFNGDMSALVEVVQKNGDSIFLDTLDPGEQFSIWGTDDGTLGTSISIFVDGMLHTEIHTSCSLPIGPGLISGDFEVISGASSEGGNLCPVASVGGEIQCLDDFPGSSACVCCAVNCPDIPATAPVDLACTPDTFDCSVLLTWKNTSDYATIFVFVDDQLTQTLPGTAETTTIPGPVTGLTEICLAGETVCGEPFPMVCCTVDCEIDPPLPVVNLACVLQDPCTCDVLVTWTNQEANYDSIQIFVDNLLQETLPGDATMVTFPLAGNVEHTICVVPIRNGVSGESECCTAQCPDVPAMAPIDLACEVGLPLECVTTVTWKNTSDYAEIIVSLDGNVVATLPGTAQSASVPLGASGTYEICLNGTTICGDPFPEVCCTVVCPFPPQPVENLMCTLTDPCDCEVLVTWENQDPDYDEIQVFLNDVLNIILPGNTESLTIFLPSPGFDFEICIVPVRTTLPAPEACCNVDCPPIDPLPPSGLDCVPDPFDCSVTATWVNESTYAFIDVLLDGTVVQTLPGDATTVTLPGILTDLHEICLQGQTICGDAFPEVCCDFDCEVTPPLPVIDLDCVLTDPCTCAVDMTWTNQERNYDEIQITLNGTLVATLPGDATSHSLNLPGPGTRDICVTPVRNTASGPQECCSVECPITEPISPVMLVCEADQDCNALITWLNQSLYENIQVFLNGVLVETLPGDAESTTVVITLPGVNEVCLQGTTVCNEAFPEVCCEVVCEGLVPPPVEDLNCVLTDPCTCSVDMTWTNADTYDEILVLLNGSEIDSLPGTATAYSLDLPMNGNTQLCIVTVRNEVESEPTCCVVECPEILATSPVDLNCEITGDPPNCSATVTWMNTSQYAEIVVTLDGTPVATLPGTAEQAIVPLPDSGQYVICVTGTTICEEPFPEVCCEVQCEQPFIRGECNDDERGLDIADGIFLILFFFQGGAPPNCLAACDLNGDGMVDISDTIFVFIHIFQDGPPPGFPYPDCGVVPGADCESYNSCP